MARVCDICGKGPITGHNISHANNKTPRRWVDTLGASVPTTDGTAGTIHWPQCWIYLGFLTVVSFVSGPWLAKHDPELFRERLGSLFQKEQKSWDKLWVIAMMVVWLGGLVLMALDGGRYHWSHVTVWVRAAP